MLNYKMWAKAVFKEEQDSVLRKQMDYKMPRMAAVFNKGSSPVGPGLILSNHKKQRVFSG